MSNAGTNSTRSHHAADQAPSAVRHLGISGGRVARVSAEPLDEADLAREGVYLTNAVKHFKFVPAERGKRRIHKTPSRGEVVACLPWLHAELARIRPALVVCLGATAAKAVLGASFKVTERRGRVERVEDHDVIATDLDGGFQAWREAGLPLEQ